MALAYQPPPIPPNNDQLPAKPAKPPSEDGSQRESREVNEGEMDKLQQEDTTVEQELAGGLDSENEDEKDAPDSTAGTKAISLFLLCIMSL